MLRQSIGWLMVLMLFSAPALATQFPFETSSCLTGAYASVDAYAASRGIVRISDGDQAQVARVKADYERWRALDREQVICRFFIYPVDGIPVVGFFIKPRNMADADLMPVIFNRGGNADGVFQSPYLYDKLAPLAQSGFLVVGSFYRGARINGEPSPHRLTDQFGGNDVNDVLQLLPIIDSFPGMKAKKVGMWGISRGGMMAFLAAKASTRFSAIIADSAPVDLLAEAQASDRMNSVFETWIPGYAQAPEAELKKRSVSYWHRELRNIPVLLLHARDDQRASPGNVLELAKQFQLSGHPYELVMYQSGGHGLRGLEEDVRIRVSSWLRQHGRVPQPPQGGPP